MLRVSPSGTVISPSIKYGEFSKAQYPLTSPGGIIVSVNKIADDQMMII